MAKLRTTEASLRKRRKTLTNVSAFAGELKYRDTGKPKMCDWCESERGLWQHHTKNGTTIYLCFGCGDH